ncbi:hypothetical protein [Chlamydia sp.]|uniref:hypothetical protein n=1 Tax=Chlamydia sp. TaxID=35827 RepID=UPI0025BBFE49|nr:hypothetical protein [Chlamydia sp.]MBQ8498336.1 hypothetical protein [Chlamydia sp.]
MLKILLIFADPIEASETLALFPFSACDNFYTYCTEHLHLDVLVLEKWGYEGVLQALTPPPSGYNLWINLGFAGATNPNIPLLTTYTITNVKELTKKTFVAREFMVTPISGLPQAQLTTVKSPYREGFHNNLQLVDMEGFFVAQQAFLSASPCSMIKVTSDYTTQKGNVFLNKNKIRLSQKLAQAFLRIHSSLVHEIKPALSTDFITLQRN